MSTATDPAAIGRGESVIVFDGVCVLCNGWVRFLLRHDRRGRYRFAAMQGESGRALLLAHGLDADDPVSFLLIENGAAWTGFWRIAALLRLLPRAVRNRLYRWFARNRYRIFGRYEQCVIPAPDQAARFLP